MKRRLTSLLLAVMTSLTLGIALAGPAAAAPAGANLEPKTHVVCAGGSGEDGQFDGVCVWVPLPF